MTIRSDEISFLKELSFHPVWGFVVGGGGGLRRGGLRLLKQFLILGSSKIQIFQIDLFHIVTSHRDEISHVKHVLDPLYMFSTHLGGGGGGGWGKVVGGGG